MYVKVLLLLYASKVEFGHVTPTPTPILLLLRLRPARIGEGVQEPSRQDAKIRVRV